MAINQIWTSKSIFIHPSTYIHPSIHPWATHTHNQILKSGDFYFLFSLAFGNRNPRVKIISFFNFWIFLFRFLEEFRQ
jgi:hypothetical protein